MSTAIVCGSRSWTTERLSTIRKRLSQLPAGTRVAHGGCRGVDQMAGHVAKELGFSVQRHPADWLKHGRAAGPIRNRTMLDAHPECECVIAFHDTLKRSKGTKHMVSLVRQRGLKVEVIA